MNIGPKKFMKTKSSTQNGRLCMVYDIGSSTTIAGFAGSCAPRCVMKNHMTGKRKTIPSQIIFESSKYIGEEENYLENIYQIEQIIKHGNIKNWDNYIEFLKIVEKNLSSDFKSHDCLFSESPMTSTEQTKNKAEILFEYFETPGLMFELDTSLCLLASGRTTGMILSSGGGITSSVPYYEGNCLSNSISKLNFGGDDITNYLSSILHERSYDNVSYSSNTMNNMKEQCCYTTLDFQKSINDAEISYQNEKSFELPDGTLITILTERFRPFEIMFNPSKINNRIPSIQDFIVSIIKKCKDEYQKDLLSNIVIAGGNTMSIGFPERLQQEIQQLNVESNVKVIAPHERKYSTWIGGSIITSWLNNDGIVTKEEYDETGVYKKNVKK